MRTLLGVVMLRGERLLDRGARKVELDALLDLLVDLRDRAPGAMQAELTRLHRSLGTVLPALLCFTVALDQVHEQVRRHLTPAHLALVACAWQRHAVLGPTRAALLEGCRWCSPAPIGRPGT